MGKSAHGLWHCAGILRSSTSRKREVISMISLILTMVIAVIGSHSLVISSMENTSRTCCEKVNFLSRSLSCLWFSCSTCGDDGVC